MFVRDETGALTGQMFEEPAMKAVLGHAPMPDPETVVQGIIDQMKYYASVGITTVTDLAYMPNEGFDLILEEIFDRQDIPVRLGTYFIK